MKIAAEMWIARASQWSCVSSASVAGLPMWFQRAHSVRKNHLLSLPLLGLVLLLVQQLLMFVVVYGEEGALTLAQTWAC